MASGSKGENRLKALAKEIPDHRITNALLLALEHKADLFQTDRMTALLGAAIIEHALQVALMSKFVPLGKTDHSNVFDGAGNGTLGSLSNKTRLGHALGLFGPQTRADIDIIRNVRNVFAHALSTRVAFKHDDVASECKKLRTVGVYNYEKDPRTRFVGAVLTISDGLRQRIALEGLGVPFRPYMRGDPPLP